MHPFSVRDLEAVLFPDSAAPRSSVSFAAITPILDKLIATHGSQHVLGLLYELRAITLAELRTFLEISAGTSILSPIKVIQ